MSQFIFYATQFALKETNNLLMRSKIQKCTINLVIFSCGTKSNLRWLLLAGGAATAGEQALV